MPFQAGFGEIDITPPAGTLKIGWIVKLSGNRIVDPLFARIAIFEAEEAAAVISLDTLSVRWTLVNELRRRITAEYGFPGTRILVAATHNHAGPAIASLGETMRDEGYVAVLKDKIVLAFGEALKRRQRAELAFGHAFEWRIAHNRRVIMRDGTTRTHWTFNDPNALCLEGPVDPEVCLVAVRAADSQAPLGCLINYSCHPTHLGGGNDFSGGYPGALAACMKAQGWPVCLYLNGACGNVHDADPTQGGRGLDKDEIGRLLAADVAALLPQLEYRADLAVGCRRQTLEVDFRKLTDKELRGTVRGAQRFVKPALYDEMMPALVDKMRKEGRQKVELQALLLGDHVIAAIPGEYFVEFGLRIKEKVWPQRALIASCANGMVGYLPTREAFSRGGYETTLYGGTRLAHNAGDQITAAMIRLILAGCRTCPL